MKDKYFDSLLDMALDEDLGEKGDVTSKAVFEAGDKSHAILVSKGSGVLCGCELFSGVFTRLDPGVKLQFLKKDGDSIFPGNRIVELDGSTLSILQGERIAINFLGFLSGIASEAARFTKASQEKGRSLILDTRKTLPGYRTLSKYAVRVGGASNHRMGLFDMVLIKDNHIDAAGGITQAVNKVRAAYKEMYTIEVECRTLDDVKEALSLGVEWIMLDNMDEKTSKLALQLNGPEMATNPKFEASGNMSIDTVGAYSALGMDYISVGALTHSVKTFDFSLRIDKKRK
jgi:nicotinate-nucleotide pyrophosphorylase (carboxylating)